MPEILRSRDCILFQKGDSITVVVSQAMLDGGWAGGQGVRWVDTGSDALVVDYGDGHFGGFLLWGSDESADQFTAMTRNQLVYQFAVMFIGGNILSTRTYERYTYASRTGGGPLVPIAYYPNAPVYQSLRGLWTIENERTLAGLPDPSEHCGWVVQLPKPNNDHFLGVQAVL